MSSQKARVSFIYPIMTLLCLSTHRLCVCIYIIFFYHSALFLHVQLLTSRYVKVVEVRKLNGTVSQTQGFGFKLSWASLVPTGRWGDTSVNYRLLRPLLNFASSRKPGFFTQGCLLSHHFPQPQRTSARLLQPILEGIFQFNFLSSFGIDTLLIRHSFKEEETSRILLSEQPSQWKSMAVTAIIPAREQNKIFQTKR